MGTAGCVQIVLLLSNYYSCTKLCCLDISLCLQPEQVARIRPTATSGSPKLLKISSPPNQAGERESDPSRTQITVSPLRYIILHLLRPITVKSSVDSTRSLFGRHTEGLSFVHPLCLSDLWSILAYYYLLQIHVSLTQIACKSFQLCKLLIHNLDIVFLYI